VLAKPGSDTVRWKDPGDEAPTALATVALDGRVLVAAVYFWRKIRADGRRSGAELMPLLVQRRQTVPATSAVMLQILANLADGRCRLCTPNPLDWVGLGMNLLPLKAFPPGGAGAPGGNCLTMDRSGLPGRFSEPRVA
jgi:hypothetical protein